MKKVCMFVVVFLSLGHSVSAESFESKLVKKLAEILSVRLDKIQVDILNQEEMRGVYFSTMMEDCMQGDPTRGLYCASRIRTEGVFVYGLWVKEKDPKFIHIKLYKEAGIEALIHEFCHWYLEYRTTPESLINNHLIVIPLSTSLLTSKELIEWLEKEKR